jgi:hypothetical protein
MYLAVMEGDIRRTARTVLRLLGRPVEQEATLGQLLEVLARESVEPMCSLLVSRANRQWRNAIAHSQVHWDPVAQKAVVGTEPTEPDAIVTAAMVAFDLCTGFETGVAIALNDAGNPHHHTVRLGHVGWSAHVMRTLGGLGVEATGFRQHGTAFSLHISGLTIGKLRDVLVGVFVAGSDVPGLGSWRITQDRFPELILDEETLDAARGLPAVEGQHHPDALALVLCAGALVNQGQHSERVVDTLIRLTSNVVLGERNRLAAGLRAGDEAAFADLANTLRHLDE